MSNVCKHKRVYAWHAFDGTLCVGCCECGKVLRGGVGRNASETQKTHEANDVRRATAPLTSGDGVTQINTREDIP